jgi:hypothetical protein
LFSKNHPAEVRPVMSSNPCEINTLGVQLGVGVGAPGVGVGVGGAGVGVGVPGATVGVGVGVGVAVITGVGDGVAVITGVGVADGVAVITGVGVAVIPGVGVAPVIVTEPFVWFGEVEFRSVSMKMKSSGVDLQVIAVDAPGILLTLTILKL